MPKTKISQINFIIESTENFNTISFILVLSYFVLDFEEILLILKW